MNEVPKDQQTYNYEPPKKRKPTKAKVAHAKEKEKVLKKSKDAMKRREKDNKTMKTLVTPGYRK